MIAALLRRAWRRRELLLAAAVFVALRLGAMGGQGLWTDELFSLALATGHSLEHPAAAAQPELGDYVEAPGPVSPARLAAYLRHDDDPAPPSRVVRAVRLSDTSPPLYYLLLWAWTRVAGSNDLALRALSLIVALAGLVPLASLARRLGGRRAVRPALLLYTVSPVAIFYGTDGRMYALLLTLAIAQAAVSVGLRRRPSTAAQWTAWTLLAAAGLWTHYFYVFVVAALATWLVVQPRRVSRRKLALCLAAAAALAAPWYLTAIANPGGWRVTSGWLDGSLGVSRELLALARLPQELLVLRLPWAPVAFGRRTLVALFALAAISLAWAPRRRAAALPAIVLGAAGGGLVVVDLVSGTHTVQVARYALAALPAIFLLAGIAVAGWPRALRVAWLAAVVLLWSPRIATLVRSEARYGSDYRGAARELDRELGADDLAIVQSIPGGVAGVARYVRGPAPILSWVELLGARSAPGDVERWSAGRHRVAFVSAHPMGDPQPAREWLEAHRIAVHRWQSPGSNAFVVIYEEPPPGLRPAP